MSESTTPPPARIVQPDLPSLRALLSVVVGVVIVSGLYFGREVLIPITLAVLLSFVLAPLVDLLRRIHFGKMPSVLVAVLLALASIVFVGGLIGTQLASLAGEVPRYVSTIERKADSVRSFVFDQAAAVMAGAGRKPATPAPSAAPSGAASGSRAAAPVAGAAPAGEEPRPQQVEVRQPEPTPFELAERILGPVLHPLATTGIVFVVAIFMLLQREDLRDRLIRLVGSNDLHRTTTALDDAARRLSRYFLATLGINATFGVLIGAGLFFIGVPSPVLWGVLAGLLRFVPYIGAPLAAALPLALAAAIDPGWSLAIWTAALFLVAEPLMGQVVEPMVYGHSTGLSPVSVIVSAIFWGWLWGPIGLILSMPLTLCLVVLGRHAERLEFIDVLLGDRPALTPAESFYQRMLAEDPDEALDQAELLLKERPLSSYYDEVALKGLQLAANDVARGVLPPERLNGVKNTVRSLVADLNGHADKNVPADASAVPDAAGPSLAEKSVPVRAAPEGSLPEPLPESWRHERAVLCVAGRGVLDEAASAMLAQLLEQHGLGAQVVTHDAVARDRIDLLDVSGVAMVCVSYLEISGNPAHLRYLLRRLKQRLPRAKILVGLWPAEEAVLSDRQLQQSVGADHYTSSLHEAVSCCLDSAREAGLAEQPRQLEAVRA